MRDGHRTRFSDLLVALLPCTAAFGADAPAAAGFEVPVVPCQLLDGGCRAGAATSQPANRPRAWGTAAAQPALIRTFMSGADSPRGGTRPVALELGPQTVTSRPGTTVLVEVSIGHLNRIVTPFRTPVVHTVSSASTQVDGSVVYLATDSEEPVALFISDGPGSATALSLTLAPRYLPPREIRLQVPGYRSPALGASAEGALPQAASGRDTGLADASADSRSAGAVSGYVGGLVETLRALAQGHRPPGYAEQKGARPAVRCLASLRVRSTSLAQSPAGGVLTVAVRNTAAHAVDLDHTACAPQGTPVSAVAAVAAMAAWPRRTLQPGEESEVFLVLAEGSRMTNPAGQPR